MAGQDFAGKRATVMGLGVLGGGVGVARYLAEHGAKVIVTDMRSEAELQSSIVQLQGLDIKFHLEDHDESDFTSERADFVVRNPGVRRDSRYLELARDSGVAVEMEMSLFFRACPAPIIGVTGTKGKTTVTALIGEILRTWNPDSFIAGNMGVSALEGLDRLTLDTPVAIELSSWQLEALHEHRMSPQVAVITNFSEDHLDRYHDYEDYVQTKRTIAHNQSEIDVVVYNNSDADVRKVRHQTIARLMPFGSQPQLADGAWIEGDCLATRFEGETLTFPHPRQLALSGDHGRLNALAAVAACQAYGVPEWAIADGLISFSGVENRLENLGTARGVRFINDTSATAPVATVSALRLLSEQPGRVFLVSGGADKQSDLTEFLDVIASRVAGIALLPGTATELVREGLINRKLDHVPIVESMDSAVDSLFAQAQSGDTVILSPGLASFGLFRNEFDRGSQFRAAFERHRNEVGQ
jgi:UDP-N-acetylmuramoylalanine--D-glutamate ligase